jgi:hypothetical protein
MEKNISIILTFAAAILIFLGAVYLLSKPKIIKSSIYNQYHVVDKKPKGEWLPDMLPKFQPCMTKGYFFNPQKNSSDNGIIEKNGYTIREKDNNYAKYTVNEKFYGLQATEILTGVNSTYYEIIMITLEGKPDEIQRLIEEKYHNKLKLYKSFENSPDNTLYLINKDNKVYLVCSLYMGADF